ncbi:MAG: lytic transglycosylase domain-containing protein [Cyclobacteriaceae bacterium]
MRKLLTISTLLLLICASAPAMVRSDTVIFYPESDLEYIPAEANYDLIEDRVSCIESEIPLNYNERVHAFVNYFAVKDRDYMRMILRRKEKFFPLFEKYLKKYGLPDELKYLSIVESGLNPTAISPARAVGLWQFMPTTGRYFGLYQDWFVDERMDPEKSTEAACKYLKQLYGMFGDWELAISAYNTGPGNVRKAIRRSGYKKTFWEIYPWLHRETRSYLPQFVAIIYVMNYADVHNFIVNDEEYEMETDTLTLINTYTWKPWPRSLTCASRTFK